MNGNRRLFVLLVALCVPSMAISFSMSTVASTWERVRTKPEKRTLRVTGAATKRIISDLIEWEAGVSTKNLDRTQAYQNLRSHVEAVTAYLKSQGIEESEIRVSSVHTQELVETQYVTEGEQRYSRSVHKGWSTRQSISITSTNIQVVERVSREVTQLLEKGVPVTSSVPEYHYTKLDELKIDMLAKASENARVRAENIVGSGGGGKLGKLWNADMGVININPANSSATSWEGNNDKSSYEKDIITIVHLTFQL